jgi:hypothetical protein
MIGWKALCLERFDWIGNVVKKNKFTWLSMYVERKSMMLTG